jgi:hypothetical protein
VRDAPRLRMTLQGLRNAGGGVDCTVAARGDGGDATCCRPAIDVSNAGIIIAPLTYTVHWAAHGAAEWGMQQRRVLQVRGAAQVP